jgi:hypothetical protein
MTGRCIEQRKARQAVNVTGLVLQFTGMNFYNADR